MGLTCLLVYENMADVHLRKVGLRSGVVLFAVIFEKIVVVVVQEEILLGRLGGFTFDVHLIHQLRASSFDQFFQLLLVFRRHFDKFR